MSTFPDEDYEPYTEPQSTAAAMAPPHSLEAEQGVLGAILLSDKTHYEYLVQTALTPDDFYRDRHRVVFETMFELYEENEPIDVLTVTEHLRSRGKLDEAGGPAEIDALAGAVPAVGNIRRYGAIVKEHALLRRLLKTTYDIQSAVHGHEAEAREIVERAETQILEVAHDDRAKDFVPVGDVLHAEIDVWQRIATEGITMTGTPSGFPDLDEMTGGFQPGNLIILAARPSMGKSALVTNIAENVALHPSNPKAVALFSLEMSEGELAQRFIASQASIKGDDLRKGRLKKERDWKRVLETAARYDAAKLFIDDSSDIGLLEIRAKARRLHQQHELGLIIVDYLQLMRADGRIENRVQQVSAMSRGLKILARELLCPVIALSQLSRGVESRTDKRPMLSDLRECVTGDTLVTLADGRRIPIEELVGTRPEVVAVDERDRLVPAVAEEVWPVGRRAVVELRLASGRRIRTTADHRLRTGGGWETVGSLVPGDRVALARDLPEPLTTDRWPEHEVVLLGQLIGDGSYLRGQPMRYTTASQENSDAVRAAAIAMGSVVRRHEGRGSWHQLVIAGNGNRWTPAGVGAWLKQLGIFDQRSGEKRVPRAAFRLPTDQIGLLLRHLWATDGSIHVDRSDRGRDKGRVAYATISRGLAEDVAALLLRLGIVARITTVAQGAHRPAHHVQVSGSAAQRRFLRLVGAFGPRVPQAEQLAGVLATRAATTNVDTLPMEVWARVRARMAERGVTTRAMADLRGTSYGGSAHFAYAPSRTVAMEYALLLEDDVLADIASCDLFWDRVVSVSPAGEEDVYDLTVPGPHCWLADGIVSHNSGGIEQDADLVMFIYRDEYYYPETTEAPGEGELIIAKHRNGGLGTVHLNFQGEYPRFLGQARED